MTLGVFGLMRDSVKYEKRVGTVVDGRWRVDRLLGWGSTSAVYEATHRNGHRSALKILHQALCADPAATDRFLREAGIANAIKHRAIVPIADDGTTAEGCAYLVLELLEGDTLEAIRQRRKGRLEIEELAPIADELMSAIAAVHAAGVIHRDLKPQNVFLTTSGQLKLLDFGTARIFDRASASSVSGTGMVNGTPAFMSPEQARGARAEVDAQSDIWSLGAMIFTTLSGAHVHAGTDPQAQLLAAAAKQARKLGDVAPSVDERIATVIDRALAFAKEDRWPDVQSMRVGFRHAVVAAVPTMRDLVAFADLLGEEGSVEETLALSEATVVAASAAVAQGDSFALATPLASVAPVGMPTEADAEREVLNVSSTQRVSSLKVGIPIPALVAGFGAMAAVILLVVFFVSGGDEPSTRSAASPEDPPSTTEAPPAAAPAPSFIVIEAPDDPRMTKQKETRPAWATAPIPKGPPAFLSAMADSDAGTAVTGASAEAGVGGGATTDEPEAKGGPAPGATREDLP